ncbi:MAG: acyl-CoA dehydrogenase family protein [Actinomycetota bacterium]|nr:acyl-CoA dehydrogenase family protein [Actinomycetota bacterium]
MSAQTDLAGDPAVAETNAPATAAHTPPAEAVETGGQRSAERPGDTEEGGLDVDALSRLLDGEHRALRVQVRETLCQPQFTHVAGLDRDAYRDQVFAWAKELAGIGIGSLSFPQAYGGRDDVAGRIAMFETLSLYDLSLLVKVGVQFGLFGGAVLRLGTESHHDRLLRDIGTMDLVGCFAMTETGHGSDVRRMGTAARYDAEAGDFVLCTPDASARKDYIGNAARHGRLAVVFAQLEVAGTGHGVHAFLVPIRDADGHPMPGVTIEDCGDKLGLNGVDNGRLSFDDVRVPRADLLDRFAQVGPDGAYASPIESDSGRFFTMIGALVEGRICISSAGLSTSKSALTIAVRYGDRRRQFGPDGEQEVRLLDYLTHQRRLLPALAKTYAIDSAQKELVARYAVAVRGEQSEEAEQRQLEALAAGLKAYSTWHATATVQACREACGGAGYLAENRFAALKADSDVFTTFEGDNTVLLQLVAKSLLSEYGSQFEDMGVLGMVRYLAGRTQAVAAEVNPFTGTSRHAGTDELGEPAFLLRSLRWREEHGVSALGRRMKNLLDKGTDPFGALLQCQDHVLATALAHVERLVLELFHRTVEAADDQLRPVLAELLQLYGLSCIEADRAWFLEHGYLSPAQGKGVVRAVNELCGRLRPLAVPLVDAFAIPDALLAAPIALA